MKIKRLMAQLIVAVAMTICLGMVSQSIAAGPCQADIAKYCSDAKGPKQELQCLKEHKQELSPKCKLHIVKALKAAKDAR